MEEIYFCQIEVAYNLRFRGIFFVQGWGEKGLMKLTFFGVEKQKTNPELQMFWIN